MTNLAARDKVKRDQILHSIADTFTNVWTVSVPEDINEIVVASPSLSGPGLLRGKGDCVEQLARIVCGRIRTEDALAKEWTETLSSAKLYTSEKC